MFCFKCGQKLENDVKFCCNCGTQIEKSAFNTNKTFPSSLTENQWYYSINGDRKGPFKRDKIEELIKQGAIKSETLLWDGTGNWKNAISTEINYLFQNNATVTSDKEIKNITNLPSAENKDKQPSKILIFGGGFIAVCFLFIIIGFIGIALDESKGKDSNTTNIANLITGKPPMPEIEYMQSMNESCCRQSCKIWPREHEILSIKMGEDCLQLKIKVEGPYIIFRVGYELFDKDGFKVDDGLAKVSEDFQKEGEMLIYKCKISIFSHQKITNAKLCIGSTSLF